MMREACWDFFVKFHEEKGAALLSPFTRVIIPKDKVVKKLLVLHKGSDNDDVWGMANDKKVVNADDVIVSAPQGMEPIPPQNQGSMLPPINQNPYAQNPGEI